MTKLHASVCDRVLARCVMVRFVVSIGALLLALVGSHNLLVGQSETGHEFPWSWYEPRILPWPCEKIDTDLGRVHQPQLNIGPNDELVVQGNESLFHSVDGGLTWKKLCVTPKGDTSGVAILKNGTILVATNLQDGYATPFVNPYTSETYTVRSFIYRSEDRGKTWSEPYELDPWPYEGVGSDASIRFTEGPDGTIYYPVSVLRIARPGKSLTPPNRNFAGQLYVSTDGGKTFRARSNLGKYHCEMDILPLGADRLLASIRYQSDPPGPRYKQTAIGFSSDGGRNWMTPRIVTHYEQQTACLVRMADGTILLPFSHKDQGQGQRFLVSYDEGKTWSKTIYDLNKNGMYASSVVMKDGTIVTAYQDRKRDSRLSILRWKAPSKAEVSKGGFFEPQKVDTDVMYLNYRLAD